MTLSHQTSKTFSEAKPIRSEKLTNFFMHKMIDIGNGSFVEEIERSVNDLLNI